MSASITPGQRFTQLIQQLGLTKYAFALSLGKTATVVQHIVDERNKPGYDLLNKVCEVYPNVSSDWLVLGRGPMLRDHNPPLSTTASATEPTPTLAGIDPADIPPVARRRNGSALQPAEIAATLALATGQPASSQNGHASAPAAAEPAARPLPAPTALAAAPPAAPVSAAPPDPAYLAAALHTTQLQHQLALSEQRNQHLLEQQALLKQLVEILQKK